MSLSAASMSIRMPRAVSIRLCRSQFCAFVALKCATLSPSFFHVYTTSFIVLSILMTTLRAVLLRAWPFCERCRLRLFIDYCAQPNDPYVTNEQNDDLYLAILARPVYHVPTSYATVRVNIMFSHTSRWPAALSQAAACRAVTRDSHQSPAQLLPHR